MKSSISLLGFLSLIPFFLMDQVSAASPLAVRSAKTIYRRGTFVEIVEPKIKAPNGDWVSISMEAPDGGGLGFYVAPDVGMCATFLGGKASDYRMAGSDLRYQLEKVAAVYERSSKSFVVRKAGGNELPIASLYCVTKIPHGPLYQKRIRERDGVAVIDLPQVKIKGTLMLYGNNDEPGERGFDDYLDYLCMVYGYGKSLGGKIGPRGEFEVPTFYYFQFFHWDSYDKPYVLEQVDVGRRLHNGGEHDGNFASILSLKCSIR